MGKRRTIESYLADKLKDPQEAIEYLRAAFSDGDKDEILIAISDVIRAREGMQKIAKQSKVARPNLYRMLEEGSNPTIENFFAVVNALGLRLTPEWNSEKQRRA
jgi:probable addiction module antidote protein